MDNSGHEKFGIVEVEADSNSPSHSISGESEAYEEKAYFSSENDELGKAASLFVEKFGNPKKVLYPACGAHVIDSLFPQSEIVYVDPLENSIRLLKDAISTRAKAIALPVEKLECIEEFDAVFSLNSHAPTDQVLKRLKQEGYIFCNNYFGTQDAEDMIQSGICTLLAVIDQAADYHEYVLQTDGLDEYLEFDASAPYPSPKRKKIALYYVFQKKQARITSEQTD